MGKSLESRASKITSRGRRLRPRLRLFVVETRSYLFNTASFRRLDPQAMPRAATREVILEALNLLCSIVLRGTYIMVLPMERRL